MKSFFSICLVLLLTGAYASANLAPMELSLTNSEGPISTGSDTSIFSQLDTMYKQGVLPTKEDVLGYRSGRCYMHDAQNTPEATLLASRIIELGGDNGPAFPAKQSHQMVVMNKKSVSADYFDEIDESELVQILSILDLDVAREVIATIEGQALVSYYHPGNIIYKVRRNGNYLVGQAVLISDQGENYRAGDIFANCYFFIKH